MAAIYSPVLDYGFRRLTGVNKQLVIKTTDSPTTIGTITATGGSGAAGEIVEFSLPTNAVIDPSSIALFFKLTTSVNAQRCRNTESLAESVSVNISGQPIELPFRGYNILYNEIMDWVGDDKKNQRTKLQWGADVGTAGGSTANGGAGDNGVAYNCVLTFPMGFFGSSKTLLPTSVLGRVEVKVRLASGKILLKGAGTGSPDFAVSGCKMSCDVYSFDNTYDTIISTLVSNGGLKIPFRQWFSVYGSQSASLSGLSWNANTMSLNKVMGTNLDSTHFNGSSDPDNKNGNTTYFKLTGNGVLSSQFQLNDINFPQTPLDTNSVYFENCKALGLVHDLVGQMRASVGDATQGFELSHYAHIFDWTVPESENSTVCGQDLRGTSTNLYFQQTGTLPNPVTPVMFIDTTRILVVHANKRLDLLY